MTRPTPFPPHSKNPRSFWRSLFWLLLALSLLVLGCQRQGCPPGRSDYRFPTASVHPSLLQVRFSPSTFKALSARGATHPTQLFPDPFSLRLPAAQGSASGGSRFSYGPLRWPLLLDAIALSPQGEELHLTARFRPLDQRLTVSFRNLLGELGQCTLGVRVGRLTLSAAYRFSYQVEGTLEARPSSPVAFLAEEVSFYRPQPCPHGNLTPVHQQIQKSLEKKIDSATQPDLLPPFGRNIPSLFGLHLASEGEHLSHVGPQPGGVGFLFRIAQAVKQDATGLQASFAGGIETTRASSCVTKPSTSPPPFPQQSPPPLPKQTPQNNPYDLAFQLPLAVANRLLYHLQAGGFFCGLHSLPQLTTQQLFPQLTWPTELKQDAPLRLRVHLLTPPQLQRLSSSSQPAALLRLGPIQLDLYATLYGAHVLLLSLETELNLQGILQQSPGRGLDFVLQKVLEPSPEKRQLRFLSSSFTHKELNKQLLTILQRLMEHLLQRVFPLPLPALAGLRLEVIHIAWAQQQGADYLRFFSELRPPLRGTTRSGLQARSPRSSSPSLSGPASSPLPRSSAASPGSAASPSSLPSAPSSPPSLGCLALPSGASPLWPGLLFLLLLPLFLYRRRLHLKRPASPSRGKNS